MNLLSNAVESIQTAIEDYDVGTPARLRSCVRGMHAGILLLFKERLRQLSPPESNEILLKANAKPEKQKDGSVKFVGSGRKTVNLHQIRDHFDALDIKLEWSRVDAVSKVRNEIEHYYTSVTQTTLHSLISAVLLVIRSFVRSELQEDPRKLLGDKTWQRMLDVDEVFQHERKECDAVLSSVKCESPTLARGLRSVSCSDCGSTLLRPTDAEIDVIDMVLCCNACGNTMNAQEFVPAAIETELAAEAYIAMKDGGEEPYTTCPSCDEDTYVLGDEMQCAFCGEEANHKCDRCSCSIPASELGGSLCGYCEHIMSKDD